MKIFTYLAFVIAFATACDNRMDYRKCESLCAPLKVDEFQPETNSRREMCQCAKPADGFITESVAAPIQPGQPDANGVD